MQKVQTSPVEKFRLASQIRFSFRKSCRNSSTGQEI